MVSCICITRNRVKLLKQSIEMFQQQTYNDKELVIVYYLDDCDTVKYIESLNMNNDLVLVGYDISDNLTLGDLRNLAISKANGTYICVWDDDDIFHPFRISEQLSVLENSIFKACTLKREVKFLISKGRLEITPYREEGWENSLLFKKDIDCKYASKNSGEDTPFLMDIYNRNLVISIDKPELYVYVYHGNNTVSMDHFNNIGNTKIRRDVLNISKNIINRFSRLDNY